jgi:hypothetical protein
VNAAVLVMVLASAMETDGAVTVFARPTAEAPNAGLHLRWRLRGDFGHFFVEGRASLMIDVDATNPFQDLGSSLSFGFRSDTFLRELRLTLWPTNADPVLPVFDWANALGRVSGPTPAVGLRAETSFGNLWATVRLRHPTDLGWIERENPLLYPEVFGGSDTSLPNGFEVGMRAGWFHDGEGSKSFVPEGTYNNSVHTLTFAGRASWTHRESIGAAMDFDLYRTDPARFERFFAPETRREPFAVVLALEAGGADQSSVIAGPDIRSERHRDTVWVDLQARVRVRDVRLFLTGRLQTTNRFDFTEVRWGFTQDDGDIGAAQLTFIGGFDWNWALVNLMPGVLLGVVNTPSGFASSVLFAKTTLKWQPVPFFIAALEVHFEQNWNLAQQQSVRAQVMAQFRF